MKKVNKKNILIPIEKTIAMRTNLPWQIYRFAVINIRMLKMIWKSHQTEIKD